jgi:ubiquinone/menaquinone biosynthesis C-methylase UbiE
MRLDPAGLSVTFLLMANRPALFERLHRLGWHSDMIEEWVRGLRLQPGQTILDVGCGPGMLTRRLAGMGMRATGFDQSGAMLRRAKRGGVVQQDGLAFVQGDAHSLPFEDGAYDHAIAASLVNVAANPLGVVGEMRRATAVGGTVSFLVPSAGMTAAVADYVARHRLHGFSAAALRAWASRAPKMTADEATFLLGQAGLGDITIRQLLEGMVVIATGTRVGRWPSPTLR